MRLRGRLDHLLDHHLDRGLSGVSPGLADVLRIGAYQLLYMGGVPAYAAVSETVDGAHRREGKGAAGLVNAVLRAVADGGEDRDVFPDPAEEPAAFLSTWGSHPDWLVERWLARWSFEEVEALVDANNRVPPLTLVPLRTDAAGAVAALAARGIRARPVDGTPAVELEDGNPAAALDALAAVVQDSAASLVAPFAAPPAGALVADLCAAPGGKALALAARGHPVVAADRSRRRLRLVRENSIRTGVDVWPVVALAERPPLTGAPVVLLDVPCTGTGTLRRHPDARWRLRPEDVESLAEVQARILHGAADVVSSGGLLVYSTCTLETEENELQVEGFLRRRPDFRLERGEDGVEERFLDGEGRLSVRPWKTGFDGAFAARLRRIG